MNVEHMTDEEFEQWKRDHGWYFTAGDLLMFIALIGFLWLVVKLG